MEGVFMSMSDHVLSAGKHGEMRLFDVTVLLKAI